MAANDETVDAYLHDELDPHASAALEEEIVANSETRDLVSDQMVIDTALRNMLGTDEEARSESIVGSVTSHITDSVGSQAADEALPTLRITNGPQAGRSHRLSEERLVIGRSVGADLTLADHAASREHSVLLREGDHYHIEDLGSANGTKVNDHKIGQPRRLRIGDRIRIGQTEITIVQTHSDRTFRLLGVDGPISGQEWSLTSDRVSIGRGSQADIRIPDKSASRINTICHRDGVGVTVEDQDSVNGTLVNGHKISGPTELRSGDRVQIGSCTFHFIDGRLDDLAGAVIPGYQLLDRVGSGSTGIVYQARNTDTDSPVAVKFFHPRLTRDAATKARLLNAARSLRRIQHRNLLPVIEEGTWNKLTYVVEPWIPNGSIEGLLGEDGTPPPEAVLAALALDAARGLQAAAAAGLVHTGLRAGDILIDDDGMGVIADLGLSEPPRYPQQDADRTYLSTEELGGADPTELSNQYALGAALLHAVSGRRPDPDANGDLPPPQRIAPQLSKAFAQVIARLTASDPRERFHDWSAVIAELERIVNRGAADLPAELTGPPPAPVPAPAPAPAAPRSANAAPSTRRQSAAPRSSRQQKNIQALIVVLAVLVVAIMVVPFLGSSPEPSRPVKPASSATDDASIPDFHITPSTRDTTSPSGAGTAETLARADEAHRARMAADRQNSDATTTTSSSSLPPRRSIETRDLADRTTPVDASSATFSASAPTPENTTTPANGSTGTTPVATATPAATSSGDAVVTLDDSTSEPPPAIVDEPAEATVAIDEPADAAVTTAMPAASDDEAPAAPPSAAKPEPAIERPRHLHINNGDRELGKQQFAEALEYYAKAAEDLGEHPYIVQQRGIAEAALAELAEADRKLSSADPAEVLDGYAIRIRVQELSRLPRSEAKHMQENYAVAAVTASDTRRQAWLAAGEAVRVDLDYDEEAPAKLQAALAAADAGEEPQRILHLLREASEAKAPFDDAAWLAQARAHAALRNDKQAARALLALSAEGQRDPVAQRLMQEVGVTAPPLAPELLCLTWIGGAENEWLTSVGFDAAGNPVAEGTGFRFRFDMSRGKGILIGEPAGGGEEPPKYKPDLKPQSTTVKATGEKLTIRYKQVHGILQQPFLTSDAGWKFWGWGKDEAEARSLMSDSRGYKIWPFPDGRHVGVMCWCDGGNSVLARHPQDLDQNLEKSDVFTGGFSNVIGGMSTMVLKIDAVDREPVSGSYMASHVFHHASDAWGRFYAGVQIGRRHAGDSAEDHFELGEGIKSGGLFVLDSDLKTLLFHAPVGGIGGDQRFGLIAVHDNLAIVGGYSSATDMAVKNPVQEAAGGGLDACLAVIKLWDKPKR